MRTANSILRTGAIILTIAAGVAARGQTTLNEQPPAEDDHFGSSVPTVPPTHIVVGHSMTVNAKRRLTRVYVSNPDVLDLYTASPTQVMVTAKKPGVGSLTLWDDQNQSHSYLISSDISLDTLRRTIKRAMPAEAIQVDGSEDEVILSGNVSTEVASETAIKLAGAYSKNVSNALVVNSATIRQVKLSVRIVEVDRSKLEQFGFNFFNTGGNNLATTSTNQFPSSITASSSGGSSGSGSGSTVGGKTVSITNALNFLFYSSKLNIGATLQDMENRQLLQILAEPNITTLSGQRASFLAGGEFPFPVVQGSTGGLSTVTIQFRPYGVKLDFTPVVNVDGTIQLKVAPEVSALDYTNSVQISGYTIPALSTRRAETQVVLKSGDSFAISGLLDKRTTDSLGRTPGIANVPILGALFKSKAINRSTTELIVIVTPEIVDPLTRTAEIQEPVKVVPMLDKKKFDATIPGASDAH